MCRAPLTKQKRGALPDLRRAPLPSRFFPKGFRYEDHLRVRFHARRRWLLHAGRVRPAGARLDGLAAPHRHLGPWREAGPEAVRRHRPRHRRVHSGHHVRQRGRLRQLPGRLRGRRQRDRHRDDHQRRLVPRHRRHLRDRRCGQQARLRLAFQRLRRPHRRPVLPVGRRRPDRREDGPAHGLRALPSRRHDPRGRLHHGGRRGHRDRHRPVPALPGPHRLGRARRGGRRGHHLARLRQEVPALERGAARLHGRAPEGVSGRGEGHLGARGHRPGGDQRSHRRRGHLHRAGRGGRHLGPTIPTTPSTASATRPTTRWPPPPMPRVVS